MTASIPRRLSSIKRLVKQYFKMEYGELVELPDQLIRVFDIRGSKHEKHPHKNHRVYMSRRSIKHFVESRRYQLESKRSSEQSIDDICFAVDNLQETLTHYDFCQVQNSGRHIYEKDFSAVKRSGIRVIIEEKEEHLEVVSIHFRKNRSIKKQK